MIIAAVLSVSSRRAAPSQLATSCRIRADRRGDDIWQHDRRHRHRRRPRASPGDGTHASAARPPTPAPPARRLTARAALAEEFVAVADAERRAASISTSHDVRPGDAKVLDAQRLVAEVQRRTSCSSRVTATSAAPTSTTSRSRRASRQVHDELPRVAGHQASRITIISYGEERPSVPSKTEDCWAKNRRAPLPRQAALTPADTTARRPAVSPCRCSRRCRLSWVSCAGAMTSHRRRRRTILLRAPR